MQEILIELDGSNHAGEVNNNWRFWCRLPGGLPLGQHGYRIGFTDLESWDLQVPAYLQPRRRALTAWGRACQNQWCIGACGTEGHRGVMVCHRWLPQWTAGQRHTIRIRQKEGTDS